MDDKDDLEIVHFIDYFKVNKSIRAFHFHIYMANKSTTRLWMCEIYETWNCETTGRIGSKCTFLEYSII